MTFAQRKKNRALAASLPVHDLSGDAPFPGLPFIAAMPGDAAPLIPLDLPPTLRGQARDRVARRQLRDALGLTEIGLDIRPARLGPRPETWARVLVTDGDERRAWLQKLGAAAGLARAVLPDYLTLPAAPDLWVIERRGSRILARLGVEDGFSAEPGLAQKLLQAAAGQPPRAVLRLGPPEPDIDALLVTLDRPLCSEAAALEAHGVTAPACFAHGELALDLARDPGAERAEMRRTLRRLGLPVGLAVLGFAGWIAATVIETRDLAAQGLAYRQNAERILREVMIPSGPILDIRSQVSQSLTRARALSSEIEAEARPLDVMRRAGAVLAEHALRVTRVSYQPGAGLVLDLQIADFAALDALVTDLRAAGTGARVAQSVTREDTGVEAVLALAVTGTGARP